MKNKKFNLILSVLIMSLLFINLIGLGLAHGGEIASSYDENMMSDAYGGMFGIGFFGWILMIVVVIALILFIAWMIKNLKKDKK